MEDVQKFVIPLIENVEQVIVGKRQAIEFITVALLGEDIAEAGTTFKVLNGLVEEFGKEQVLDTPISKSGFTGLAVGAAMTGMRPIVDIMFGDFSGLIMDQVANQAAKIHYMSGGKLKVPMALRTPNAAGRL